MEDYKNSCMMLMTSLYTGIDLHGIFEESDLKDTGIELDSHLTVFYSHDVIQKDNIINDVENLLGEDDFNELINKFKEDKKYKVLDYFDLSKFENDSDYLILKLRQDTDLYNTLKIINSGLSGKYNIKSDFGEYKPHMTLAELEPGTAKNYIFSDKLNIVLESALFTLDDFVISYEIENSEEKYKHYNLTHYNAISRYFRQEELRRDSEYYKNNL